MIKTITKFTAVIAAIAGALYQVDRLVVSGAGARTVARVTGLPWAAGVGMVGAWFEAVLALMMLVVAASFVTAFVVRVYAEGARPMALAVWAAGLGGAGLLISANAIAEPLSDPRVSGVLYDARWLAIAVIGSAAVVAPVRRARMLRLAQARQAELEAWQQERIRQEHAGLRPRWLTEPTAEEQAAIDAERERGRQVVAGGAVLMRAYRRAEQQRAVSGEVANKVEGTRRQF